MAHKAKYTERLEWKNNKLYRIIKAHYKNTHLDVFKQELGSDNQYIRNIDLYSTCYGWVFLDPHDKVRYGSETIGIEKWFKCMCNCGLGGESEQNYTDIELMLWHTQYEDFIYTLRAMKNKQNKVESLLYVFNTLNSWTKNSKVELLIKAGYSSLANNMRFLKLKENKQKKIIKILQDKKAPSYASLNDLLVMANTNCSYELAGFGGDERLKNYLLEQNESIAYYRDYIKLAKYLNKDIHDNYWKYPKSLSEAHNKCAKEWEEVCKVNEMLKMKKENEIICKKIVSLGKRLSKVLNTTIGDYEISVASSLDDIREQADTLSQCLITCKYYEKYANKKCILVFVKKGNKRLATAEVFYEKDNPLGQFYGDEKDRNNCLPNKSIKTAFNTWLNNTYLTSGIATA